MIHFTGWPDIIDYAARNINSRAIKRAFCEGRVQRWGEYREHVPGSRHPGWLIRVTSRHGTVWNVAVTADDERHTYHVWVAPMRPFEEAEYGLGI